MRKLRTIGSYALLHKWSSSGGVHASALLSAAMFFVATLPAEAARNVTFASGPGHINCGTWIFTARGFGVAKTTLTITATNTPGSPGTMVIGSMTNKNNFAKSAAIPYQLSGPTESSSITVVLRVKGPAGNSATTNLYISPGTPFSWGPSTYCP